MSFSLTLPYPPSLNKMYRNVPGRGRVKTSAYKNWASNALHSLRNQQIERVTGPVRISIKVEDKHPRADADNLVKPLFDFLVTHRFIEEDHSRIVRSFSIAWAPVEGAVVYVEAA